MIVLLCKPLTILLTTLASRTKRAPAPPTYTHALNHTDTESKMHIGILEQAKRRPSIMFRV